MEEGTTLQLARSWAAALCAEPPKSVGALANVRRVAGISTLCRNIQKSTAATLVHRAPCATPQGEKVATVCDAANVRAFPTWVIGGKTIEGELDLDEVERELDRVEREAAAAAATQ